ncbi:MAG: DnaA regulatory inactivator Hda [Pseudomonadales bacterium]|jgi:DnaA family protein|nr:DnaA regulatory inactivator Hda [Pseudomonadales bacterium]
MARQLPLGVGLRDAATFEAFEPAANGVALGWLRRAVAAAGVPGLGERGWFWGGAGSGRTHLLQAACHAAVADGASAICLPAAAIAEAPGAVLDGLEQCRVVAIDDAGPLAGEDGCERALFDLCNRLQARGGLLLVAADGAPLAYRWGLPDLASRLAAAAVFRLRPLDDDGRVAALQRRARLRGMTLPGRTARFILARFPRDAEALFALLDELDTASLSAQRPLTVPFVRELLAGRTP